MANYTHYSQYKTSLFKEDQSTKTHTHTHTHTCFLILTRKKIIKSIMRTIWTIIKPISHRVRLPKKSQFRFQSHTLLFSYLWNINNIGQQSSQLWNNTIRKGPPTIRIIIRILETGKIGTPRSRLTTQSGTCIYIKENLLSEEYWEFQTSYSANGLVLLNHSIKS